MATFSEWKNWWRQQAGSYSCLQVPLVPARKAHQESTAGFNLAAAYGPEKTSSMPKRQRLHCSCSFISGVRSTWLELILSSLPVKVAKQQHKTTPKSMPGHCRKKKVHREDRISPSGLPSLSKNRSPRTWFTGMRGRWIKSDYRFHSKAAKISIPQQGPLPMDDGKRQTLPPPVPRRRRQQQHRWRWWWWWLQRWRLPCAQWLCISCGGQ